MVEDFVYLGSLVRSTTQSSPDISCHNSITRKTVLNQDNQIWKSKSTIYMSTKLKYYNTCILPIFLYSSWAVTRDLLMIEDLNQWRLRKLLGIKWHHHVRNNNEVRWTTRQPLFWLLSKHGISPCSAALPECQMKQMHESRRSQQLPLNNRRRLPRHPRTTWMT